MQPQRNNNMNRQQGGRPQQRDGGVRRDRVDRERDPFQEKVLDMRRVTRVVAGGKRFRFRATVVVGDGTGRIGVGVGKGLDTQQAIAKGKAKAMKDCARVPLIERRTIAHQVEAKYSAARVLIKPAQHGHGLRAGSAVRSVLALAGIKDATAKVLGRTPNKLTNALATIAALKQIKSVKPRAEA